MNTIDNITSRLISEFGADKPIIAYAEGNVLVLKINGNEARVYNWISMPVDSIISSVRGTAIKESTSHSTLLCG